MSPSRASKRNHCRGFSLHCTVCYALSLTPNVFFGLFWDECKTSGSTKGDVVYVGFEPCTVFCTVYVRHIARH